MYIGYELEFFGASLEKIGKKYNIPYGTKKIKQNDSKFALQTEIGITRYFDKKGGELISPIYNNIFYCKKDLKEKVEILNLYKAYLKENAEDTGFHIHLDREIFCDDVKRYQIFFEFLVAFQNEIFDFAKGIEKEIRLGYVDYARPLRKERIDSLIKERKILKYLKTYYSKRNCIRFSREYNTVELRYFNASLFDRVLEEYLEFAWRLGLMIKEKTYDEEIIHFYYDTYEIASGVKRNRKEAMSRLLQ